MLRSSLNRVLRQTPRSIFSPAPLVRSFAAVPDFHYQELFAIDPEREAKTPFKKLTSEGVSTIEVEGKFLQDLYITSLYLKKYIRNFTSSLWMIIFLSFLF